MTETPLHACPSQFALEKFIAGVFASTSTEARHISTCEHCQAALRSLRSDGLAYLASDEARALRQLLAERARPRRLWLNTWARWTAPAAAAVVVAVVAGVRLLGTGDGLTPKGGATVQLLVGRAGKVRAWSGGQLEAGDVLQLSRTSGTVGFVAVIGREDGGKTEVWFPAEPRSESVAAGTQALGGSLRFDPPFAGTVYVFTSPEPFEVLPLLEAIRSGGAPALPPLTAVFRIPKGP
jgi:hypothetical protein